MTALAPQPAPVWGSRIVPASWLRAVVAIVFCLGLVVPAATAQAATLSPDLADAAKDACIRSAKAQGYNVDDVVSAKQALGDRSNVVLRLSKGNDRYEFTCGYTEAIKKTMTATPAVAPAVAPARETVQQPINPRADRERVVVNNRRDERIADRVERRAERNVERTERRGVPGILWLLPLLLLPLFAFLLRQRTEETDASAVKVASYAQPQAQPRQAVTVSTVNTSSRPAASMATTEVAIHNNGESIMIYAGPSIANGVTGALPDGQKVALTGRREHDWVELASGGWIEAKYLAKGAMA
jgi:hypothetical protein